MGRDKTTGIVTVDGKTKHSPVTHYPGGKVEDRGAYDPERGKANFVVVRAEMQGGADGGGMNGHDRYPDGLHITARRLVPADGGLGDYDDSAETIEFYLDGCFNCVVPRKKIRVVGKMRQTFVPCA